MNAPAFLSSCAPPHDPLFFSPSAMPCDPIGSSGKPAAILPAVNPSPAGTPSPAGEPGLPAVLAMRREQAEKWGHTLASDAEKPLRHFLRDLKDYADAALDDHQFFPTELPRVRKRVVKLAALGLATIARIQAEQEADARLEQEIPF